MPPLSDIGMGYIIFISLMAVLVTAVDKYKAQHGHWRIPEATLFSIALLGGAAAMYATMQAIRHKTRHRRFMWGLPAIVLAQVAGVVWLMR